MNIQWLIDFFVTHAVVMLYGAIILIMSVGIIIVIVATLNRRSLANRSTEWIEITPPALITKTPEATEQLFSVIHGQHTARSFKDKLLHRLPIMSFEITSTRKSGIRYLVQVQSSQSSALQKAITSYVPEAKVAVVDYSVNSLNQVIEFKETGHYVLPLTLTSAFEQYDPLAYITGAMTKLGDDESITLQLVMKPIKLQEASKIAQQIMANENILASVNSGGLKAISKVGDAINNTLMGALELAGDVYYDSATNYRSTASSQSMSAKNAQFKSQVANRERPARTITSFELELMESMHKKIMQPLFRVDLRILIAGNNAKVHAATFRSALDGYSVSHYQSLKAKLKLPFIYSRRVKLGIKRLPALLSKNSLVLSSSEVASLYHFPSTRISRTDNLITSLSRTLPAPISLKQNAAFDVIIGENIHRDTITPIGLTEKERERHVYVIGGTGNGKTTMLQYKIVQDMRNGKGVAIVDPHGDMAETLLRYIPQERINDVVYFNPDDLEYPIGLNLLELTPGLMGNELLREKDIITESVISVFRKIFSEEDTGGHRIEYVLRNTVQTALTIENATLFTVFDLLNDTKYRKSIIKNLEDKNLINFWKNELGKAGDMQKVKMAAGITAKIGRFLFSASAKQILEQPKSTIDFDDIINSGKILICNFSKGLIGEDTSELFGITVLAKLQLASLRRARIAQKDRKHFYLYVDEFQNFATPSFVQMLSEARKYKMFMVMAEQSTSQQKDQQMVNIILANVGTVISFRTGNPSDEQALLPLFSPYIEQNEISNLPSFNFYAKLSAVQPQEPLSGQTLLLDDEGSPVIAQRVIKLSRKLFAKKQEEKTEPVKPQSEINKTTKNKKEEVVLKSTANTVLEIEDIKG